MNATATPPALATQVYQVYIRADAERIWEAITQPEFTVQYFYGAHIEYQGERRVSHGPDGSLWGDEAVIEMDAPRRLVHEWRSQYDEEMSREQPSRVTWEIEPRDDGTCLLTVTHDRLEGAPKTAASVSGAGWMYVLSGLKTVLETGRPLGG
jgi:uncharacterized protein YndB with AHSA1/START domain